MISKKKYTAAMDSVKFKDKAAKVETARNLWIPAINNHGGFGRWAFLEIVDPWDAKNTIRAFLKKKQQPESPLFRISK